MIMIAYPGLFWTQFCVSRDLFDVGSQAHLVPAELVLHDL